MGQTLKNSAMMFTTVAISQAMPEKLITWMDDVRREGLTPLPPFIVPPGWTAEQVRQAYLAMSNRPEYVFLFGAVPVFTQLASLDGHPARDTDATGYGFQEGALSLDTRRQDRVWFNQAVTTEAKIGCYRADNIPITGRTALENYAAYLDKRHRYSLQGAKGIRNRVGCDDHFGGEHPEFGQAVRAALRVFGSAFDDVAPNVLPTDDFVGDDGVLNLLRFRSYLVYAFLSGGWFFSDKSGEYYVGLSDRWWADQPRVLIAAVEGSFLCDYWAINNFCQVIASSETTLCCVYLGWILANLSSIAAGGRQGDEALRSMRENQNAFCIVTGDPTVAIVPESDPIAAINDRLDTMEATFGAQIHDLSTSVVAIQSALTVTPPLPSRTFLRAVNCGGPALAGYAADNALLAGTTAYLVPGVPLVPTASAFPAVVYKTLRYASPAALVFDLAGFTPGQALSLTFGWMEPNTPPSARSIWVKVNGDTVLSGINPATAAGGSLAPYEQTVQHAADASGNIHIEIGGTAAFLSAIGVGASKGVA